MGDTNQNSPPDEVDVQALREGDEATWYDAAARLEKAAWKVFKRYPYLAEADAKDIFQDTLISLRTEALPKAKTFSYLIGFVRMRARRGAIAVIRKSEALNKARAASEVRPTAANADEEPDADPCEDLGGGSEFSHANEQPASANPAEDEDAPSIDLVEVIQPCLDKMPHKEKWAFIYTHTDPRLKHKEIAEKLRVDTRDVGQYYARAKKKLIAFLEAKGIRRGGTDTSH